jgi:hypothetical protein
LKAKGSIISPIHDSRHLPIREFNMRATKFMVSVLVAFMAPLLFTSQAIGDQEDTAEVASLTDQLKTIEDEVNPAAWNIRNGCVTLKRIKRIKFLDDQTALLSMRSRHPGKKKIILKLRRQCPGIKRSGYVHKSSGFKLCAGFDRFSVLGSGFSCRIESLEPYVSIEEPKPAIDLD